MATKKVIKDRTATNTNKTVNKSVKAKKEKLVFEASHKVIGKQIETLANLAEEGIDMAEEFADGKKKSAKDLRLLLNDIKKICTPLRAAIQGVVNANRVPRQAKAKKTTGKGKEKTTAKNKRSVKK